MLKTKPSDLHLYKWGGIACFLLAVCFIVPSFIYLTGNLRDAMGPLFIPWPIFFTVPSGLPAL